MQPTKIILINVFVTFLEGFGAAWVVSGNASSKTALVGAFAGGISAVWNVCVKPYLKQKTSLYK